MGFAVEVEAVDFKFSAGHFVAYKGFRERLHGHNYTVKVRLNGEKLNADGYILDFGDVKRETKAACKVDDDQQSTTAVFNDAPDSSKQLAATNIRSRIRRQIEIYTQDGSFFSLPEEDCKFLPLIHTTAEEFAKYLWFDIRRRLGGPLYLYEQRGIRSMEVSVAERPIQRAVFEADIREPADE